jgi:cytochrome c peroxidase
MARSKVWLRLVTAAATVTSLSGAMACGEDPAEDVVAEGELVAEPSMFCDENADAIGRSNTVSPTPIVLGPTNPFFGELGTNERTCGTCHQERLGWTITPQFAQSRPVTDALFRFDGSDCLPAGVLNPSPETNSTQMLSKANVRIELGIPAGADFTLVSSTDPLDCPTPASAARLRMYRRPLPTSNTHFLSTVMWDGRENSHAPNNTVALIEANLSTQANDATTVHAQAQSDIPVPTRSAIVAFETGTFNAQDKIGTLKLSSAGAKGGAEALYRMKDDFFIGINDVLACAIPGSCQPGKTASFSSIIFTAFAAWETRPRNPTAAAIGRGEVVFNTKSFPIDNVGGINRDPGDPVGAGVVLNGFCGTCHDSPNIGNHSTSLPIDIGVTAATPVGGLDVAALPTYTFAETATGRTVTVTDPGRALVSGRFRDIGKTKGPNLRALATRAPYFHNGSANDLMAVVDFYDVRFHINFTEQEKSDLVAFLQAL